jgi:hypothetical protein
MKYIIVILLLFFVGCKKYTYQGDWCYKTMYTYIDKTVNNIDTVPHWHIITFDFYNDINEDSIWLRIFEKDNTTKKPDSIKVGSQYCTCSCKVITYSYNKWQ